MVAYRMPTNSAVVSSAGMARESQDEAFRNAGILGLHGREAQLALTDRAGTDFWGSMTPYSARGGGGGGGGSSLADSYANAFKDAKTANEKRYDDILGGYVSRYERGIRDINTLGGHERNRINQHFDNVGSQRQQGMVGGAFNSTVRGNMRTGVARERTEALGGAEERIRGQRAAADADLSKGTLDFMERKTEKYPDLSQLIALQRAQGAAGVGAAQQIPGGGVTSFGFQLPGGGGGFPMGGYMPRFQVGGGARPGGNLGGFMRGAPVPAGAFGAAGGGASGGGAGAFVSSIAPGVDSGDGMGGGGYVAGSYPTWSEDAWNTPMNPRSIMEPAAGAGQYFPGSTDYKQRFDPRSIMEHGTSPRQWFPGTTDYRSR